MKTVSNNTNQSPANQSARFPKMPPAVLVVDDDPKVGEVLVEFLSGEGFNVSYEVNGSKALNHIEHDRPNVVLADMRMPVMDGVTLLKEITHRWDDIDVIMMSATESPAGLPVPFIQKPFDLDDVISTICHCETID